MISLQSLATKLKNEKSAALFCHVRPDGDSIGSAIALSLALQSLGIKSDVYSDDEIPDKFLFLNGTKAVKNQMEGEYTAFVAIDCADLARLGKFQEDFIKHKNTYCIDHHVSNTRFAKENYVIDRAANAENILDLIEELGTPITTDIANLLSTGIITDTGNFKHKNVTPETLYSAGKLMAKGADFNEICYYMFSAQSKARALLFGKTMSHIRYLLEGKLAIATVRLIDFEEAGAKQSDTEGFIDFLTGIEGVEVSCCIMETGKDKYKISFRSKQTDVNAVAGSFGGGGHVLAAGCMICGEYEEVVDKIRFAVSREIKE